MARDIRIHCRDHTSYSIGGGERKKAEHMREKGRWQLCAVITVQGGQGYTSKPRHTYTHSHAHAH